MKWQNLALTSAANWQFIIIHYNCNILLVAAVYDGEDPYPSLSGYHDYEPQLEFDDAELLERKPEPDVEDGEGWTEDERISHILFLSQTWRMLRPWPQPEAGTSWSPQYQMEQSMRISPRLSPRKLTWLAKLVHPQLPWWTPRYSEVTQTPRCFCLSTIFNFQRRLLRTIVTLLSTVLWMSLATIKEEER